MTRTYSRLAAASIALTGWAIVAASFAFKLRSASEDGTGTVEPVLLLIAGTGAVGWLAVLINRLLQRRNQQLASLAERQVVYIDSLPMRLVPLAIFGYAAQSLFLELAVIRWQASAISILAFYKNYSLVSAFAGLGLGYALFRRKHSPLFLVIPVLGVQLTVFWALRTTPFAGNLDAVRLNPFAEQATIGVAQAGSAVEFASVYLTLAAVFFATALAFIPIGQVVGRLMNRTNNLHGYGLNLAGSLAGVAAMYFLSFLWTPPSVWFGIAFLALIPLLRFSPRVAMASAGVALFVVLLIALPPDAGTRDTYSPYQLLEQTSTPSGDLVIRAGGHFLLSATDLRPEAVANDPSLAHLAAYYEFPFQTADSLNRVLIVGAGAGNDVAAALRLGADHIDAVEVDPAVAALGRDGHPERPYEDTRVTTVIDDARAYFSSTTDVYDLIVYGLLDSHSVVSHGSSVRLDSFVYTIEGLREARQRLAPGGVLSLSFAAFNFELAEKLYLMLTEAFDGVNPIVVSMGTKGYVYLHGSPQPPSVSSDLLPSLGLRDVTADVAGLSLGTDVATDDWPFLYMPRRVYPVSYLGMVALVAILSAVLIRSFFRHGLEIGNVGFFMLGAGFLLIETKGITELGLAFGNTWQVVGLVIGAVLVMAYLANLAVARLPGIRLKPVVVLLPLSVGLGFALSVTGALASNGIGKWLALAVLTFPVFFSGLAFSLGLKVAASVPGVLAANLSGAIAGGLVEYNSLLFGFRSLYPMAAGLFILGGVLLLRESRKESRERVPTPAIHDNDHAAAPRQ